MDIIDFLRNELEVLYILIYISIEIILSG